MKQFKYRALDARGNECDGYIKAEEYIIAIRNLRDIGLYPLAVTEVSDGVNDMPMPLRVKSAAKSLGPPFWFAVGLIIGVLLTILLSIITSL
jgi:type II secretory pathway component PulF